MNTPSHIAAQSLQAPANARIAGAGFALVMTLAMLLGVHMLASVEQPTAQMATAQPAAVAAQS